MILGAAGFGNAAGPLIGGALTEAISWRAIMFLNLPVSIIAGLVIWRYVKRAELAPDEAGIDYKGIAALSVGLVSLLLALDQGNDYGWGDPRILVCFALAASLLVAFPFIERRAGAGALVPPDVIKNREFRAVAFAVLLMSATFFAAILYLPQFMQKILDYTPLQAGIGLLPMMVVFAAASFIAGPLYNRLGSKLIVSIGSVCLFAGMVAISTIDAGSEYMSLVPGMVVLGIGVGIFYSSVTTAGVTALDPSRSSLAGGIVYMCQIAGGAIGLGLTTTIFTARSQDKLNDVLSSAGPEKDAAETVLSGTGSMLDAIEKFPQAAPVIREAFAAGMELAFRVDALLALSGVAVSVLFVGGSLLRHRAQSSNST